jgi:hypothetical protein
LIFSTIIKMQMLPAMQEANATTAETTAMMIGIRMGLKNALRVSQPHRFLSGA